MLARLLLGTVLEVRQSEFDHSFVRSCRKAIAGWFGRDPDHAKGNGSATGGENNADTHPRTSPK